MKLLTVFSVLLLLGGCKHTASFSTVENVTDSAESAWNSYFGAEHYPYDIQSDCKPFFARANPDVKYMGSILLFHGYTACPQQFFEMRDYLVALGFNVLAPLLPGQGRGPTQASGGTEADRARYYQFIPSIEDKGGETYRLFVEDMNLIMSKLSGPKLVGGLSVGGALAVGAMLSNPLLYDKGLILAPFFTVPPDNFWRPIEPKEEGLKSRWSAFYANAKLKIANDVRRAVLLHKTDWIPKDKLELRWGEYCYRDNAAGRAGICDTHMKNLAAVVQYGDWVKDLAKSKAQQTSRIQFIGVEYDDGSDTRATKEMVAALSKNKGIKTSLCFYRGFPHSFLSRYDHPHDAMAWLPAFHEKVKRFLLKDEEFPTSGPSEELVKDSSLVGGAIAATFKSKPKNENPEDYFQLCAEY